MTDIAQAYIGNGTYFGVDSDQQMFVKQTQNDGFTIKLTLGYASERNLNVVLLHIGSMRIHTERNT